MRPAPSARFEPDDVLLEIDRHDQPVCVALYIEDDTLGCNDAGGGIGPLHLGRVSPARLLHLVEPGIEGGLLILQDWTSEAP